MGNESIIFFGPLTFVVYLEFEDMDSRPSAPSIEHDAILEALLFRSIMLVGGQLVGGRLGMERHFMGFRVVGSVVALHEH